jgi:hypothetical protein
LAKGEYSPTPLVPRQANAAAIDQQIEPSRFLRWILGGDGRISNRVLVRWDQS